MTKVIAALLSIVIYPVALCVVAYEIAKCRIEADVAAQFDAKESK